MTRAITGKPAPDGWGAGGYIRFGIFCVALLAVGLGGWAATPEAAANISVAIPAPAQMSNTEALGLVLYTKYIYLFQAAGLILLVAMIGAIVLTHRARPGVRRQKISVQVGRPREEVIEIRKVTSGEGV